jgi:hypothetical protein
MARFYRTNPETGLRLCSTCNDSFPTSHFHVITRRGGTEFMTACKACDSKRVKAYRDRIRLAAIDFYSDGTRRCAHCGEGRIPVLDLDHVNGNGREHRPVKGIGGYRAYQHALQVEDKTQYRILCRNCNWIARWGENNGSEVQRVE